jgi:hypothetical protein
MNRSNTKPHFFGPVGLLGKGLAIKVSHPPFLSLAAASVTLRGKNFGLQILRFSSCSTEVKTVFKHVQTPFENANSP